MQEVEDILAWLAANGNERNKAGMARFGINVSNACGVSISLLRKEARNHRNRHDMALELFDTGVHEAMIMACMIASPRLLSAAQMDQWTYRFDSWDVCDQCCINLFWRSTHAIKKIDEYCADGREFVRRTGFVLMAALAVKDKTLSDADVACWLPIIAKYSYDDRNFVKKAANWALRQIGKRNMVLNAAARDMATRLAATGDKNARWIGRNALRELSAPKTLEFIALHRDKGHTAVATRNK